MSKFYSLLSDAEVEVAYNRAWYDAGKCWSIFRSTPKEKAWLRQTLFDNCVDAESRWHALKDECQKRSKAALAAAEKELAAYDSAYYS